MFLLVAAKLSYPPEAEAAHAAASAPSISKYPGAFWIYIAAAGCLAIGYADFAIIGYHFTRTRIATPEQVPLFYAGAMCMNALSALAFGKWYDRQGIVALIGGAVLAAASLPLCFLGGFNAAIAGMIAWGAGMGAIDAVLRAGVSKLVSMNKRGAAFGVFNAAYGLAWFAGSLVMGRLYDWDVRSLVWFGVTAQAIAIAAFLWFRGVTERRVV
jgi:predicted MFS family arabinose efflux permease